MVSPYPILISWFLSLFVKAAKEEKGRKAEKERYLLISTLLHLRFSLELCSEEMSSGLFENRRFFPNQALKFTSRFRDSLVHYSKFSVVVSEVHYLVF